VYQRSQRGSARNHSAPNARMYDVLTAWKDTFRQNIVDMARMGAGNVFTLGGEPTPFGRKRWWVVS